MDPLDTGVASSIMFFGMAEPHVTEVFRKITRPGMTILDIGANIGWYTLLGANLVGPSGKVISVEPEPRNFNMLAESVKMNNLRNVRLINACISQSSGKVKLYLSATNQGGHSIIYPTDHYVESDAVTIDQILKQEGKVDILKIDAESAEPLIFEGGTSLLKQNFRLHILMEYSPLAWKGYEDLLSMLFAEFRVFKIRYSPFLLKRIRRDRLPNTRQCMLYLVREPNGLPKLNAL